ncbi:uncharacterized protein BP01DRAFT_387414 [Aspergillus saccharolyticus JOP 1030-1]|uniref:Uncharacterized protein n=1 Tax=Aspergillus saccharolyticus JOP 1030-1 TaxID=1450539 RepID=A0A318Z261_9EURO|nr:hypothetical protein BP01DRAFT_387414 [Aspergillus saccharolyticus JOP 1030-1]PYH40367.1 hypothetical protein BP01DRAFT_387414 [Aspergillus saccharolyticus JOP 1030-1]
MLPRVAAPLIPELGLQSSVSAFEHVNLLTLRVLKTNHRILRLLSPFLQFASKIANSMNRPADVNTNKPGDVYGGAPPAGYTGGPPSSLQPGGATGGFQQQQPQQQQSQQYQAYSGSPAPVGGPVS